MSSAGQKTGESERVIAIIVGIAWIILIGLAFIAAVLASGWFIKRIIDLFLPEVSTKPKRRLGWR